VPQRIEDEDENEDDRTLVRRRARNGGHTRALP